MNGVPSFISPNHLDYMGMFGNLLQGFILLAEAIVDGTAITGY